MSYYYKQERPQVRSILKETRIDSDDLPDINDFVSKPNNDYSEEHINAT